MKKFITLLGCFFLLVPGLAMASVIRSNDIAPNETVAANTYLTGQNPLVAGVIQGDLMATGGNIYVSGSVLQDAMLAGGTVNVTGHIGGDLRVFAGNLMVDGPVDGELMVFGGNVTIGPHAVIQGDVNVFGGHTQVDPAAKLLGATINIRAGEKSGSVTQTNTPDMTNQFLTMAFWITQLMMLIGVFSIIAIINILFPNFTKSFVKECSPKLFWKRFFLGLVLIIVMPVTAILCFITAIGAILGVVILVAYLAFFVASAVYGGVVLGGLLYELIRKPKKINMGWWWLVLGVVGLHVIGWLPVIGWMIGAVFFLTAWGTMAMVHWNQMKG